jgi:hypothetical protein
MQLNSEPGNKLEIKIHAKHTCFGEKDKMETGKVEF